MKNFRGVDKGYPYITLTGRTGSTPGGGHEWSVSGRDSGRGVSTLEHSRTIEEASDAAGEPGVGLRPALGAADVVPLVGVRLEVVAEAEHAFGNLFHRLHYFAQKLEAKGAEGAAALESAVGDLEELLRLFLDYASPLAVSSQPVAVDLVARSLSTALGRPAPPTAGEGIRVVADPGHLSEAFRLMRRAFGSRDDAPPPPGARVEEHDGVRWLVLDGTEPGRKGIAGGAAAVAWAQAQKLVEAQGGLLHVLPADGGTSWLVRLPLPGEEG